MIAFVHDMPTPVRVCVCVQRVFVYLTSLLGNFDTERRYVLHSGLLCFTPDLRSGSVRQPREDECP